MASISWDTDASDGGNTLGSPRPDPANRFFAVKLDYDFAGPLRNAVGNAAPHAFKFREDYFVGLEIRHLPPSAQTTALDLKTWLMDGGVVTITTDDVDDNEYEGLTLRPGTKPEFELADEARQHWTFRCELRSASRILIDYSG